MTSPKSTLHDIPGGEALIEWFGRVPRFHDAELRELAFSGKGNGLLRIQAWNTTDQVDAQGYFVLDRHATVTLALEGVSAIDCVDVDMVPAIIFDLAITQGEGNYRIEWSASYGAAGVVTARHVRISVAPGPTYTKHLS